MVSLVTSPTRDESVLVAKLVFNEDQPSLYHLAILATVVHSASPVYRLFSSNCYHFAATMLYVLRLKYPGSDFDIPDDASAGTWCGLSLTSGIEEDAGQLLTTFDKQVDEFVGLFSFLHPCY